jgi:hypothetical protein
LEIGDDLIGLFAGRILGDHDKAFDRRGGITRVAGRDRNPMLGFGKGGRDTGAGGETTAVSRAASPRQWYLARMVPTT